MTIRILLLLAVAGALMIAGCGEDESSSSSGGPAGNSTDGAFVRAMVPHHEDAVDMAEIAQRRSRRPEIKELASAIISTQEAEIEQLRDYDRTLTDAGIEAGDLGMDEHAMGTDMDAAALETAKPFDREFIDMMIPHHQGAIRMAHMELADGDNADVKRLAEAIVDAQSEEIDQMNTWRVDWFGAVSPAGGVPAEEDHGSGHGM